MGMTKYKKARELRVLPRKYGLIWKQGEERGNKLGESKTSRN